MLWAVSFSFIGVYLAGQVDPWFCIAVRLSLAACLFLPFLVKSIRTQHLTPWQCGQMMSIGAIQLGCMYGFYYHSFLYCTVPIVLLATILTPFYIVLIDYLFTKKFKPWIILSALLACLAAYVMRYTPVKTPSLMGILLVQGANIAFASGQVLYNRVIRKNPHILQHQAMSWFYIGACLCGLSCWFALGDPSALPTNSLQWGLLVYLGLIASGLGYFLWNKGITQVNIGTTALMNNAVIPLGILVHILFWGQSFAISQILIGSALFLLAFKFHDGIAQPQSNRQVTSKFIHKPL
jgi:carboxylate/amino acid/amine transporter